MVQSLQGVATDDKGRRLSGAPQPVPSSSAAANLERDELSEYIEMMQEYKDLPLGEEEDDLQSVVASEDAASNSNSDQESEGEKSRKKQRLDMVQSSRRKNLSFEEKFACNQGGTKDSSIDTNPNSRTIEVLQSMCDYYSRIDDHWRTTSYRKAIATLKRQVTKVTTKEDAKRLPNIGDRLAQKIEEIVTTNRLKRLEYAQKEPMDEVLQRFLNVYDVGLSRANKWISQGYRTLQDLLDRADLTPNQRVGVVHYDDLNSRIPRREVEALGAHVRKRAAKIDKDIELLIGGSFRRGADTSGDIDFIVTKKGTDSTADLVPFLEELISVLQGEDFLVATLASLHSHRRSKEGPGSKWHGCCVLPRIPDGFNDSDTYRPVWRRVDFLLVPETEYGAALIYFTGNDIFNRSMRLLASKKGMRLNQRGLYKEVMRGNNRVKVTEGELVEGRDERRIFEILGVKWREPRDRWC
jgi:DNA polymerase lambda/DNA polymerase IV